MRPVAAAGAVGDVEDRLIGREGEAVGPVHVGDLGGHLSGLRIDAIDVAAVLLLLALVALESLSMP